MKKYILALLFTSAITFSSCDDLFRDRPIDTLPPDIIWTEPSVLDGYVLPWYRNMSHGFSVYLPTTAILKGATRDYLPWYGDQMTVGRIEWYNTAYGDILKSNTEEIQRRGLIVWSNCYTQIKSINVLFENKDKIPEGAQKERVLAEAHFFRAYYYYMLLRQYGGVLLMEKKLDPIVDPVKYPRASYDQMLDFILADAKEAENLDPDQAGDNLGRIKKSAAIMLRAKLYLWAASAKFQNAEKNYLGFESDRSQEMLTKAKEAYDDLFKLKKNDLIQISATTKDGIVEAYRNIFLTKHSQESVLELQHANDGNFDTGFGHKLDREAAAPFYTGTTAAYCPTQNHVDEYRMSNGKRITDAGSGYDSKNPYKDRDYRFDANILYDGAKYNNHVLEIHYNLVNGKQEAAVDLTKYGASTSAAVTNTGYYLGKFVDKTQSIDNDPKVGSKQNYIIWRYAEALLDYAEISFKLGDPATALGKVNEVRKRVHVPELETITWDDIVNERRVELAFEESTYWDMFRWGIAFDKMNGSKNPLRGVKIIKDEIAGTTKYEEIIVNRKDDRIRKFREIQYFLPIPWGDIRYHGIDQNPEWKEV